MMTCLLTCLPHARCFAEAYRLLTLPLQPALSHGWARTWPTCHISTPPSCSWVMQSQLIMLKLQQAGACCSNGTQRHSDFTAQDTCGQARLQGQTVLEGVCAGDAIAQARPRYNHPAAVLCRIAHAQCVVWVPWNRQACTGNQRSGSESCVTSAYLVHDLFEDWCELM